LLFEREGENAMPVKFEYLESERVVHYVATDPWTLDEMNECTKQTKQIFDAATDPIFTLIDMSRAKALPQGAMRARSNPEVTHPKAAGLVIVGASVLVRTISGVVAKLANRDNIYFYEKEADAWAFVRSKKGEKQPTP
jgi:hypothetical protein